MICFKFFISYVLLTATLAHAASQVKVVKAQTWQCNGQDVVLPARLPGWQAQHRVRSFIACGVLCTQTKGCASVNYQQSSQMCQLNKNAASACGNLAFSTEWQYYAFRPKYRLFTDYRTWSNAKSFCKSKGGWLAEIRTAGDQAEIEQLLRDKGCPTRCFATQVWVGGAHNGNQWLWDRDGTRVGASYSNWHVTFGDSVQSGFKCLAVQPHGWSNGFGQWMRYVCSYPRPYFCQYF